ncbi:MAG: RICIN domain-containing protein [Bacteroidota bacterium]|nr:RICIN domain-containing protein [Bacteroidota bacterium]
MKNFFFALLLLGCFNTLNASYISQRNWRWRNDNGTETSATWKAAENTTITLNDLNTLRLRLELDNNTGDSLNFDKELQFATNKRGPWKRVGYIAGNSEFMLACKNDFVKDGQTTTQQLTGSSANLFKNGKVLVSSEENYQMLKSKTKTEYEWVIKPTENIEKNTTYYFRSPVGDYPVELPSVAASADIPCKPRIISNGSFEADLTGWVSSASDGGAATFGVNTVDSVVHTGYKSLKASVTALGSKVSSVQTSTVFDASKDSIHLLQFWARSKVDEASLVAAIIDGNDTIKCHFRTRIGWYDDPAKTSTKNDSHGGWHQYHFPFKAKSSSVKLQFYFQSVSDYYIDDVEVLDQSNGTIDVYTSYMWHYNRTGNGWYTGDNDVSVTLPDGRVAWFFNDSFIGNNNPFENVFPNGNFVRNAMVVHDKNKKLSTMYSTTGGNGNTFFIPTEPDPNGYPNQLYWVADGVVEGGKLKEMLVEVDYPAGSDATQTTGRNYLATFNLSTLGLEKIDRMSVGYDYETIIDDGDYYYLYGGVNAGLGGYTKIARAKKGDLIGANTPWQFYNTKYGWYTNKDSASHVCSYVANGAKKLGPGNYVLVTNDAMSGQEKLTFAPTPVGPWTKSILLFQVPEEVNYWNYMPNIHDDLYTPGKYSISYSVNCYEKWGPAFNDKYFYWPRYVQADLLKISPYTNRSNKTVESGKTYKIIARHSNKALQVNANGIKVEQSSYINGANQLWVITDVGEGYYKITDAVSGKALEVSYASMDNGGTVQLGTYDNGYNQKWTIDSVDTEHFRLINRNSGRAMEIASADLSNGAGANQWDYLNQTNQQWIIALPSASITAIENSKNLATSVISLYPNPVSNILYINGLANNAELEVYNMQSVKLKEVFGKTVDVSDLTPGAYLLRLKVDNTLQTKMFIKSK